MPRREHLTILVETLREIERASHELGSVSLTRLAARSNVPFDRFRENVLELERRGLLAVGAELVVTSKGNALLRKLDVWEAALREAGLATHES